MHKPYVASELHTFSAPEVLNKATWLAQANDPMWREWMATLDAALCPSCCVLLLVPYNEHDRTYSLRHTAVTHELGCPCG